MTTAIRRKALVDFLVKMPANMRSRLDELKKKSKELRRRPDLLWYLLLQSAATRGNSSGSKRLFQKEGEIPESVRYSTLEALSPKEREPRILSTLRDAGIRMQTIKAPRLAENFERIAEMGGVEAATQYMLNLPGQKEKFRFICSFSDIGAKYGRNIWMDIYDPSFRTAIAVDERIKKIAKAIGLQTQTYSEIENFFCQIAEESGLEAWELDRLLYNFTEDFLGVITNAT